MIENNKIAVIIPCFKVRAHIESLIERIPEYVDWILCVDDCCPEQSGLAVKQLQLDRNIKVLFHSTNGGVGAAMKSGLLEAKLLGCDVAVKIDGDNQMNPADIARFVNPIILGLCDYTKGNRFFELDSLLSMPKRRIFGNVCLSFMSKLSSGYWNLFDPTNGFTAIHLSILEYIQIEKVNDRYFYESDMLFRLYNFRCVVKDITIKAHYADEVSNLKILPTIPLFLVGHSLNFFKRIFYNYILRDFNFASLCLIFGVPIILFGCFLSVNFWWMSFQTGNFNSAGSVVLCALLIIVGMQLVLSFLNYDLSNIPKVPVHTSIVQSETKEQQNEED